MCHYTGGQWTSIGNGSYTGDATSGSITSASQPTSFSPFTFGTVSNTNPLPVTLTKFTGKAVNGTAKLSWTTASEVNNAGFEVMKSANGSKWTKLGFVTGKGNANYASDYTFTDAALTQNSYYKLRQLDFDGTATESQVISLSLENTSLEVVAYPNPFETGVTLSISTNSEAVAKVSITNAIGKTVSSKELQVIQGANIFNNLLENVAKGVYTIRVNQGNETAILRVVKK